MNDAPGRLGLAVLRDALLVPPEPGPTPLYPFVLGVFDASGRPVPEAAWRHRALDLATAPPRPPMRRIAGRHAYGGQLVPHFGHGLLDALARAWHLRAAPETPVLWHRQGPGVSPATGRRCSASQGLPRRRSTSSSRP
ncbi:hypothetical protein [Neoroseomonas rubea]|uniref:hypothetical protein n=1 Tax=Neoroseomonas rubea TaxID=2748666 RepID=UPI0018E064A0|nr:hypothetical protein [Roseomonas rubea]